jgi:hypothetical protein
MLCQECGMEGRWWRSESGAWRDIHAARGLANPEPVAANELATLRAESARLREALTEIIREQQSEAQAGTGEYQRGYDDCIAAHADIARAALAAKEPGHD